MTWLINLSVLVGRMHLGVVFEAMDGPGSRLLLSRKVLVHWPRSITFILGSRVEKMKRKLERRRRMETKMEKEEGFF